MLLRKGLRLRFNLVIEYLILSSEPQVGPLAVGHKFQSRNRVSYPFKDAETSRQAQAWASFNLVIEYLILSRTSLLRLVGSCWTCFNLVIEYLILSRRSKALKKSWLISFNLVIEYLILSSSRTKRCSSRDWMIVSIS